MSVRIRDTARGSELKRSAPLFAALGDPTRLRIVSKLCTGGPASITRLTQATRVTRQAVTKHLHVLESAGLARCTRMGRECVWEMEPERLRDARRDLEVISRQWDDALPRPKVFVEGGHSIGSEGRGRMEAPAPRRPPGRVAG
jgi:DNA-binding transcriptional ArsR family regulator